MCVHQILLFEQINLSSVADLMQAFETKFFLTCLFNSIAFSHCLFISWVLFTPRHLLRLFFFPKCFVLTIFSQSRAPGKGNETDPASLAQRGPAHLPYFCSSLGHLARVAVEEKGADGLSILLFLLPLQWDIRGARKCLFHLSETLSPLFTNSHLTMWIHTLLIMWDSSVTDSDCLLHMPPWVYVSRVAFPSYKTAVGQWWLTQASAAVSLNTSPNFPEVFGWDANWMAIDNRKSHCRFRIYRIMES